MPKFFIDGTIGYDSELFPDKPNDFDCHGFAIVAADEREAMNEVHRVLREVALSDGEDPGFFTLILRLQEVDPVTFADPAAYETWLDNYEKYVLIRRDEDGREMVGADATFEDGTKVDMIDSRGMVSSVVDSNGDSIQLTPENLAYIKESAQELARSGALERGEVTMSDAVKAVEAHLHKRVN